MKKIVSLILCAVLLVACGSNTTKQNESTANKPTVDTGTTDTGKASNTEWKWDLLKKDTYSEITLFSKYEAGIPLYDRKDLGGMVYMGSSKDNGGKLDRAYVFKHYTVSNSKYKITDISELESKFLVKENNIFFRGLAGMLPGSGMYEWKITEKSAKKHLDIEFVKVKAEITAYHSEELGGGLAAIHKEKPELKSYVEGYFTILDTDEGKQLFAIYRNWTNETSKKTEEKSKRVVEQLIESIRVKQ